VVQHRAEHDRFAGPGEKLDGVAEVRAWVARDLVQDVDPLGSDSGPFQPLAHLNPYQLVIDARIHTYPDQS